jgi:hypothetical protein
MHIWSFFPPLIILKTPHTKLITKLLNSYSSYSFIFFFPIFSRQFSFSLVAMKNHSLIAKNWTPSPRHYFHGSLFLPKFPITISTPPPFHFQKSFSQKVGKSGEVPLKVFEELSRRRPPIFRGSIVVLFNPIAIHVGVNNLLLTLWHYIMPKLPYIGQ